MASENQPTLDTASMPNTILVCPAFCAEVYAHTRPVGILDQIISQYRFQLSDRAYIHQ